MSFSPKMRFRAVKIVHIYVGGDCRGARGKNGLIGRLIEWMADQNICDEARLARYRAGSGPFVDDFDAPIARRVRNWLVDQPEIVVEADDTEAGD